MCRCNPRGMTPGGVGVSVVEFGARIRFRAWVGSVNAEWAAVAEHAPAYFTGLDSDKDVIHRLFSLT
jgi:hypothetical protein